MNPLYLIGLLLSIAVFLYLVVVLFLPEKFS
ncbi:MAG: potassium-transporting ATPase subunit F [Magnetococcales bacterium]|nr:potassium-transporting ATPase subunit F [Magnetococcales bacterium]MBF0114322.1 potassium-transporting ATPase subunit F [Magnetococcales bacterium]